MRAWSVIFGIGLVILWLAGLNNPNAQGWLTWFDGFAAVLAFVLSSSFSEYSTRRATFVGPVALSVGLFALWLVSLATAAPSWQGWWTFIFGCGFLILGLAARRPPAAIRPTEVRPAEERERFKKGA